MSDDVPSTGRELRSTVNDDGTVTLAVREFDLAEPGPDEVVIRVEAAPINPSDLGMLFGMADLDTAVAAGTTELPAVSASMSRGVLAANAARVGRPMPVGNEGGGTVVATPHG